jgi:predicted GNAT family acetyltransferase
MSKQFNPAVPPVDEFFTGKNPFDAKQYQFDPANTGHINTGNIWDDFRGKGLDVAVFAEAINQRSSAACMAVG